MSNNIAASSLSTPPAPATTSQVPTAYFVLIFLSILYVVGWIFRYISNRRAGAMLMGKSWTSTSMGAHAGVHSIQGRRPHMEDTFTAATALNNDGQKAFYGVFDGHGGDRASKFSAEQLPSTIAKISWNDFSSQGPIPDLRNAFKQLDHDWLRMAERYDWDDGSTAICALLLHDMLYVCNVGDSRAVLCRAGKAVAMSVDHKPNREDEKRRIEKLGGRIVYYGTWRVEGILAVTRAIGDKKLKTYVSAVPEIKAQKLDDKDDYLILASDGVWDVLDNQEAADIVYNTISSLPPDPSSSSSTSSSLSSSSSFSGSAKGDGRSGSSAATCHRAAQAAAQMLAETAFRKGSLDNITAVVISLAHFRS